MKPLFDEKNVEILLKSLGNRNPVAVPAGFTASVMERIRADMDSSVRSFDGIYKKFLLASSIIAAASVIVALNVFSSYTPGVAEFAVTDFFNVAIF